MDKATPGGRANQRRRTRKDLLEAAGRLMNQGRTPTLEEIAEEALVSRATAYRYFASLDDLLIEAALDVAMPAPETVFGDGPLEDAARRLERVDAAFDAMMAANEGPLRIMLARALERGARAPDPDAPRRQNRRTPLIEAALEPHRKAFSPEAFATLSRALALVVGSEGMIVFKDVLQLDPAEARRVKAWVIRALVEAARRER